MIRAIAIFIIAGIASAQPVTEEKTPFVVYSKSESEIPAVPAPPEPRSGIAYVYSVPVTEASPQNTDMAMMVSDGVGKGEAEPLDPSELILREVTVSKKVGFFKEPPKSQSNEQQSSDPLDPQVNES